MSRRCSLASPSSCCHEMSARAHAEQAALGGVAPPKVCLRGYAGGVSTQQMKSILTILGHRLHKCRPGCHVLVFLDAASQHLAADVIACVARLRIILLVLPARLTWPLQPLDTHVFAPLKRELQAAQLISHAPHAEGVLELLESVSHLQIAIRRTLTDRTRQHVMASNGLLGNTSTLRAQVQQHLLGALPLPLRPPTADELRHIVGRFRRGLCEALFLPLPAITSPAGGGVAPQPKPLPSPPLPKAQPLAPGFVSEGTRFRHLRC